MKRITTLLTTMLIAIGLPAQVTEELEMAFQQALQDQMNYTGDFGVAATVIMPNGDTWNGVAGIDRFGNPIADSTIFFGGSTLKTFVATLILMLEEDGLLSTEDMLTDHLNPINNVDAAVTITQLLNHTSGIYDYLENPDAIDDIFLIPSHFYIPGEVLDSYLNQPPLFAPGTDWSYSNSNYVILGLIIEAATGNSLQHELRTRIWEPLEMNRTYLGGFESFTEPEAGLWTNDGAGSLIELNDLDRTAFLTQAWGDGGIATTSADEAKFVRALINGEILSDAALSKMIEIISESTEIYSTDLTIAYGLGLEKWDISGDIQFGHSGSIVNQTIMMHSATSGFTIVTMTNSETDEFVSYSEIVETLLDGLVTSAEEIALPKSKISVSPNPFYDNISIALDGVSNAQDFTVSVSNIQGKKVFAFRNERLLELKDLPKGMYFLTIEHDTRTETLKIVKE